MPFWKMGNSEKWLRCNSFFFQNDLLCRPRVANLPLSPTPPLLSPAGGLISNKYFCLIYFQPKSDICIRLIWVIGTPTSLTKCKNTLLVINIPSLEKLSTNSKIYNLYSHKSDTLVGRYKQVCYPIIKQIYFKFISSINCATHTFEIVSPIIHRQKMDYKWLIYYSCGCWCTM